MTMGPGGTLFVGTRATAPSTPLVDAGDGTRAAEVLTLAKDLNEPNGVAVKDGALYVDGDLAHPALRRRSRNASRTRPRPSS